VTYTLKEKIIFSYKPTAPPTPIDDEGGTRILSPPTYESLPLCDSTRHSVCPGNIQFPGRTIPFKIISSQIFEYG
jgi:hypothetical protein